MEAKRLDERGGGGAALRLRAPGEMGGMAVAVVLVGVGGDSSASLVLPGVLPRAVGAGC